MSDSSDTVCLAQLVMLDPHLTLALVLTNLGEKMSDDEVDELLKAVDTSSGEINYMGMYGLPTTTLKANTSFRPGQDHPGKLR